jgi:hypothetical protein
MRQDKLTEEDVGKYFYVEDSTGDPFFMIGIVSSAHLEKESEEFTFRSNISHSINSDNSFKWDTGWCYVYKTERLYRDATAEEKHWLDECIKVGKFISKEEAMITFNPISEPQIFN